jgi:hypothetical protein
MSHAQQSTLEQYREKLGPISYATDDHAGFLRIVVQGCLYRIDRDGGFYDGCRLSADDLRALMAGADR